MSVASVILDEGGIRHQNRGERRYIPYDGIADVELRTRMLRDPVVTIIPIAGESLTLFVGPSALEIHRALAEYLGARRAPRITIGAAWRRESRALMEWLEAVTVSRGVGYREGPSLHDTLSIFEDAYADREDRAAAAYLLGRIADGSEEVRMARVALTRSLPPLVQITLRLSDGGEAFVSDAALTEAASFAPDIDSDELRAAVARARPSDERRRHALERARQELAEEARHSVSVSPVAEQRHGLVQIDRNASRWIGRSWGL